MSSLAYSCWSFSFRHIISIKCIQLSISQIVFYSLCKTFFLHFAYMLEKLKYFIKYRNNTIPINMSLITYTIRIALIDNLEFHELHNFMSLFLISKASGFVDPTFLFCSVVGCICSRKQIAAIVDVQLLWVQINRNYGLRTSQPLSWRWLPCWNFSSNETFAWLPSKSPEISEIYIIFIKTGCIYYIPV